MQRHTPFLVAFIMCVPGSAQSQRVPDGSDIPVGARVSVVLPDSLRPSSFLTRSRSLMGTVARATNDTLYLQVGTPDTVRVARSSMRRLFISRGISRSRSALQQGVFAGAMFMLIAQGTPDNRTSFGDALPYGAAGVGLGAIVGALFPYEHWRRVR
jgi:hypothetical protein